MNKTSAVAVAMVLLGACGTVEDYAGENDGRYRISGKMSEGTCPGQSTNLEGWLLLEGQFSPSSQDGGCVVTTAVTADSLLIESVCQEKRQTVTGVFEGGSLEGTLTVEREMCSYTYEFTGTKE